MSLQIRSSNKIIPSNYYTRPISIPRIPERHEDDKLLVPTRDSLPLISLNRPSKFAAKYSTSLSSLLRSFTNVIIRFRPTMLVPTCSKYLSFPSQLALTPTLQRKVTGTLYGHRHGHVTFSIQDDSRSEPVLILELGITTSTLVKEMSTGLVRIALECKKVEKSRQVHLLNEPRWSMLCNGRKCAYAVPRTCMGYDWHVLNTIRSVSIGAGVIPVVEDGRKGTEGELLYMRAKFERVVGSKDSAAFYMMNPDGSLGPELSIFLLRM